MMRFFTGLHQPSDAQHFDAAFISVNRIRKRKSAFAVGDWIITGIKGEHYPCKPDIFAATYEPEPDA